MPFRSGPSAKVSFTVGMVVFMIGPFAIPFIASKFNIEKNGRTAEWFWCAALAGRAAHL